MINLDIIRAACIKANPEIVELKFGCEVRTKNSPTKVVFVLRHFAENTYRLAWIDKTGVFEFYGKDTELKIIGRPIRLADVLLAWHAQGEKELAEGKIPVPMQGMYGKIAIKWNLHLDDLTQQSEETITFLAELLK